MSPSYRCGNFARHNNSFHSLIAFITFLLISSKPFLTLANDADVSNSKNSHGTKSSSSSSSTSVYVANCKELREALIDTDIVLIRVYGDIDCLSEDFDSPIIIHRNIEITGEISMSNITTESEESTQIMKEHSVNWHNCSNVIVAERGALIFFKDLLIYQDKMTISGLNFDFISTRNGATAIFAGSVVVVESCPQPVKSYNSIVNDLPRPQFLAGEQVTYPVDSISLFVQDVSIWWPKINSLWQICNTIFVCSMNDPNDPLLSKHVLSGSLANTCAKLEGGYIVDSLQDPADMDTNNTENAIVLVVVVFLIMAITALITCCIIHNRKKTQKKLMENCKAVNKNLNDSKDGSCSSTDKSFNMDSDKCKGMSRKPYDDLFKKHINVPLVDVEIGTLLGRGGFGRVYRGTWKGTTVAIKVIEHGERLMENAFKLPFEAYLSKNVHHPNVVQTFLIHTRQQDNPNGITLNTLEFPEETTMSGIKRGSKVNTDSTVRTDYFSKLAQGQAEANGGGELFETWLVLEFCDRGSLAKAVRKGILNDNQTQDPILDHVLLSALDVANAMNYLHSLSIIHGDLKADNVLLKSAGTDRRGYFCKVSDFGLSRFIGEHNFMQTYTHGTITHMPPESLKDGILSLAVDVYSFGVFLWELLSQTHPFPDKNHGEVLMAVVSDGCRPPIDDSFPKDYADLIQECWHQDRFQRPTFSKIVKRLKRMLMEIEMKNAASGSGTESVGSGGGGGGGGSIGGYHRCSASRSHSRNRLLISSKNGLSLEKIEKKEESKMNKKSHLKTPSMEVVPESDTSNDRKIGPDSATSMPRPGISNSRKNMSIQANKDANGADLDHDIIIIRRSDSHISPTSPSHQLRSTKSFDPGAVATDNQSTHQLASLNVTSSVPLPSSTMTSNPVAPSEFNETTLYQHNHQTMNSERWASLNTMTSSSSNLSSYQEIKNNDTYSSTPGAESRSEMSDNI